MNVIQVKQRVVFEVPCPVKKRSVAYSTCEKCRWNTLPGMFSDEIACGADEELSRVEFKVGDVWRDVYNGEGFEVTITEVTQPHPYGEIYVRTRSMDADAVHANQYFPLGIARLYLKRP